MKTTDAPTEKDRVDWNEAREEPIPPGTPQVLVDRIRDNRAMTKNIMGRARAIPENFRGIRDADGNLQAAAIITNEPNHLYVDYFATAPWNVLRNSPKSVRNAGAILMAELVKESMNDPKEIRKGRLQLYAITGSVSFYEGLGFVEDQASGDMVLSIEAANKLLKLVEAMQ